VDQEYFASVWIFRIVMLFLGILSIFSLMHGDLYTAIIYMFLFYSFFFFYPRRISIVRFTEHLIKLVLQILKI